MSNSFFFLVLKLKLSYTISRVIIMHYYEKLIIMIVIFLGVSIGTAGIIGVYVSTTRAADAKNNEELPANVIILENLNLF